jgi:hypothetical protein
MKRHYTLEREDDKRQGDPALAMERTSGLSRRRFLRAGAAAALMVVGPSVVNAQHQPGSASGRTRRRGAATTSGSAVLFREPKAVSSQNGKLTVQLDTVWASWPFSCTGTPPTDRIPTYNGQVTGPTLYPIL